MIDENEALQEMTFKRRNALRHRMQLRYNLTAVIVVKMETLLATASIRILHCYQNNFGTFPPRQLDRLIAARGWSGNRGSTAHIYSRSFLVQWTAKEIFSLRVKMQFWATEVFLILDSWRFCIFICIFICIFAYLFNTEQLSFLQIHF